MNYRQQAKRGRRSDSKERMDQDLNLLLNMIAAGGAGAEPSLPKSWSRGRSTSRSKSRSKSRSNSKSHGVVKERNYRRKGRGRSRSRRHRRHVKGIDPHELVWQHPEILRWHGQIPKLNPKYFDPSGKPWGWHGNSASQSTRVRTNVRSRSGSRSRSRSPQMTARGTARGAHPLDLLSTTQLTSLVQQLNPHV
jgi:hypothetical protein